MAALSWHLFWFFFLVPEVKIPSYPQHKSSAVFLGAILKESDLISFSGGGQKTKIINMESQEDYAKKTYFQKELSSIHKPVVFLKPSAGLKTSKSSHAQVPQNVSALSFGVSDINHYLNNIDFSDMKNMFLREELSSAMDFKIIMNKRGIVVSIVKYVGSGDPVLDFYIMRKFKMAVFKQPFIQTGWVKVHFKIRE